MLERKVAALFQEGKLASRICTSSANEASAAAIVVELQPADVINILEGDWLPAFVKGLSPDSLFRALAPTVAQHRGLQPLTPSEVSAKNVLLASDASQQSQIAGECAAAMHEAKTGTAVAAFLSSRNEVPVEWRSLITSAASRKLPLVFVLHLDEPPQLRNARGQRTGRNPALLNGVPAITVDAADPVALYRVAYEAILRARQGRGATLIHCAAWPNPANEAAQRSSRPSLLDPIITIETYLKDQGIETGPHVRQIIMEFSRDLDLATRFLEAASK